MAHISMAQCYAHGKGVESSSEKAFQNYLEASKSSTFVTMSFVFLYLRFCSFFR